MAATFCRAECKQDTERDKYAKQLKQDGKVYNAGQWKVYRNQNWMALVKRVNSNACKPLTFPGSHAPSLV